MARPLRIEYPGAWYHVMNRGLARDDVFWTQEDGRRFLDLLGDLSRRFGVECHGYCLMSNHYHLLLHTPHGNLGRAMRHLDGVYTQRFNRAHNRDGPIFRGRYKAILIDADSYLLQVSRYIHRNPVEAGMVEQPEHYRWSSYRVYLGRSAAPDWLMSAVVLGMIGGSNPERDYRRYVEQGIDGEMEHFYGRARWAPVLGTSAFRERIRVQYLDDADNQEKRGDVRALEDDVSIEEVMAAVAEEFGVDRQHLCRDGRGRDNTPRAVSMALCRELGGHRLTRVAEAHQAGHYATVSRAVRRVRERAAREPDLERQLRRLERRFRQE